jgi:hypothetical protein
MSVDFEVQAESQDKRIITVKIVFPVGGGYKESDYLVEWPIL